MGTIQISLLFFASVLSANAGDNKAGALKRARLEAVEAYKKEQAAEAAKVKQAEEAKRRASANQKRAKAEQEMIDNLTKRASNPGGAARLGASTQGSFGNSGNSGTSGSANPSPSKGTSYSQSVHTDQSRGQIRNAIRDMRSRKRKSRRSAPTGW